MEVAQGGSAPAAEVPERPSGSKHARADRVFRVALIGVLCGLALTPLVALFLPWLVALDPGASGPVQLLAVCLGGNVALTTAALGPSGEPPGARLAVRVGLVLAISGIVVVLLGAVLGLCLPSLAGGRLDRASLAALTVGGIGLSLSVAVLGALAAGLSPRRGAPASPGLPSSGVPLSRLVGGAAGVVTAATWAIACAHLIGHLRANARQGAVDEASDLVNILATRDPAELERLAPELAPPSGFIGRIGAHDELVAGSGVGLPREATVELHEGPPALCRVLAPRRRPTALPCAVRALPDGTRLVVAVNPGRAPVASALLFFGVGLGAVALAFAVGAALGRGPAEELNRVAHALDELAHSNGDIDVAGASGLDRPIVAVSLDEVGDLAVALAQLRQRLRPGLVEHEVALARARAADAERDRLLALVSEELRRPLERILGGARTLLEDQSPPLASSQREDVRLIVTSATHLTGLIEEVLDLSAIATGQVQLRLDQFDLGTMVSDVARAHRPLLGSRAPEAKPEAKVEIKVDIPAEPARLRADERRLRQVVTNLVSNAVKFTAAGSITLGVRREPGALVLSVADTGSGIAPDELPRLFTEFVQLGNLHQRARGTGLGLAICKRLIEAHGGSITAESELGRGTTFRVRLPLGEESA